MRLADSLKEKLLDKRLRDKFVTEGRVSQAEIDKYLAALPDDEGKFEQTDVELKENMVYSEEK